MKQHFHLQLDQDHLNVYFVQLNNMELNHNEMKDFFVVFLLLFDHQQLHLKHSIDNLCQINNHAILDMQHLNITISKFEIQKKKKRTFTIIGHKGIN